MLFVYAARKNGISDRLETLWFKLLKKGLAHINEALVKNTNMLTQ